MYNGNVYGTTEPTGVLGILIMMLPLLLVVAVMVTIFGKKRNERKMSRLGVELEMIRKDRSRNDNIGAHARAISALLKDIRRLGNKGDLTAEESNLFDRLRNHVHQRYRLSKEEWEAYWANTRISDDIADVGYTHRTMEQNHKAVTDGSLTEPGGWEVVTAPLMDNEISPSVQELSFVARQGNYIDASCGTHQHHGLVDPSVGFEGASPEQRWWMMCVNGATNIIYSFWQSEIDKMVSPSRRGRKQYTAPLPPYFDKTVTNSVGAQFMFGVDEQGSLRYPNVNQAYRHMLRPAGRNADNLVPNLYWGMYERDQRTGDVRSEYFAIDPTTSTGDRGGELRNHEIHVYHRQDGTVDRHLVPKTGNGNIIRYMTQKQAAAIWNRNYKSMFLELVGGGMSKRDAHAYMASRNYFKVRDNGFDLACVTAYSMLSQSGGFNTTSDESFNPEPWREEGMLYHNGSVWPESFPRSQRCNSDFRYTHLNPYSLQKYGTIENRQHQGMLNPTKVLMWAEFNDNIINKAAEAVENGRLRLPRTKNFYSMMRWLGFAKDDEFVQMWRRRVSAINRDGYNVENDIKCTSCREHYCDRDSACGEPSTLQYETLVGDLEENNIETWVHRIEPSCHECGSYLSHMSDCYIEEAEWNSVGDSVHTYCEECEEYTNFSLSATALGVVAGLAMGVVSPVALLVGCGIGLIHAAGKKWRFTNRTKTLWVELEDRGKQAAGMAWVKTDGRRGWWKGPMSATTMVKNSDKKGVKDGKSMQQMLTDDTTAVWLHTRFATHGTNNAENAHPHFGPKKQVYLVHNGVVHNYSQVWKDLGLEPTGPVDSQAVAAALEVGGIEKVVETCQGSMSLIWSDKRDPAGTIKFWTNGGNPLAFGRVDTTDGPVAVASTMDILESTWALPDKVIKNDPDTGKRLKKKKWQRIERTRLATSYSCTIGREYTIHPDGKITTRDIDGSEATAYKYYDWRTYATDYNGYGYNKATKATGNADNCTLTRPGFSPKTAHYGLDIDEVLGHLWDLIDYTRVSWEPFTLITHDGVEVEFDGYDGPMMCGVREYGDGSVQTYDVPQNIANIILQCFNHDDFEEAVWSILVGHHFVSGTRVTSFDSFYHL
jgi:hypothetical protein